MLQIIADAIAAATFDRAPPSPRLRAGMEAADAAWLAERRSRLRHATEAPIPASHHRPEAPALALHFEMSAPAPASRPEGDASVSASRPGADAEGPAPRHEPGAPEPAPRSVGEAPLPALRHRTRPAPADPSPRPALSRRAPVRIDLGFGA